MPEQAAAKEFELHTTAEKENTSVKITKLAQGLPVGGEIEQLDDRTLFSAFKNRVPVTET